MNGNRNLSLRGGTLLADTPSLKARVFKTRSIAFQFQLQSIYLPEKKNIYSHSIFCKNDS